MTERILTARREYGPHHVDGCDPYGGQWVVRDEDGQYVDNSRYRHDLMGRYPGLVVEGN